MNAVKDVNKIMDEYDESDKNQLWILQTYKALRD